MTNTATNYPCAYFSCTRPAALWDGPDPLCQEHWDEKRVRWHRQQEELRELHRRVDMERKWERAFRFAAHGLRAHLARKALGFYPETLVISNTSRDRDCEGYSVRGGFEPIPGGVRIE